MTLFILLSCVCLVSASLLITNKNPVYSVLCLVLLFVCGSILLLMLGLDFLPFVFIVVYVGAIAVLFLFVVIILDIKLGSHPKNLQQIPIVVFFSFSVFTLLNSVVKPYKSLNHTRFLEYPQDYYDIYTPDFYNFDDHSSLNTLGQVLYTEYMLHFVIAGFVLLVAIIGAIVLTSRRRQISIKQKVFKQVERHNMIGRNKNI
jgi:NADH-quinone oxidoreductase subunit J